MKIAKALSWSFCGLLVVAMLALIASVSVGAIVVGNLWLLLPLALYAYAFFVLGQCADSAAEVERLGKEIRKLDLPDRR